MNRTASILSLVLAAGAAQAQSFNIDFEAFSGVGSGVPSPAFGGAAASPGSWNPILGSSPTDVTLYGLNGSNTAVTLTRATNGAFGANDAASTTGSYQALLDDYQQITNGTLTYTFNNLASGMYAVYTYGADPNSQYNLSTISVTGAASDSQATQYIGGPMPSNGFAPGITHSVHFKNVTDGHLTITVADGFLTRGLISGIQLVKLPTTASRIRLFVDANASGTNDGGSWAGAFTDLQSALATASRGGGSHFEIWVANGFYEPTQGTDRAATFSIPSGVHIYGGFTGNETTLAQRGAPLNTPTYLTGAIGGSAATDNSYTVVTLDTCDNSTIFDGFFIARGYNDDTGHGGGMVVLNSSSPIIRNCDFTTNSAADGGAAIYTHNSSARIINSTFYKGSAYNGVGGAIEAEGPLGSIAVHNCRFLGNYAVGEGGAICTSNSSSEIANCFFSGNSSSFQAGAIKGSGSTQSMTITNCTLSLNSSAGSCGGVYVSGGMGLALRNSILWGNDGGTGAPVGDQQYKVSGATASLAFNCIQGTNANPLFINAAGPDGIAGTFDDDCHLTQGSTSIDYADATLLPNDTGDVDGNGNFSESLPIDLDGNPRRVEILTSANTGVGTPPLDRGCYEFQLSSWCYANCDDSISAPTLNVLDFTCFLNKFAAGDPYANCDGSTNPPVINVLDFSCFLNKFAAGCP